MWGSLTSVYPTSDMPRDWANSFSSVRNSGVTVCCPVYRFLSIDLTDLNNSRREPKRYFAYDGMVLTLEYRLPYLILISGTMRPSLKWGSPYRTLSTGLMCLYSLGMGNFILILLRLRINDGN